MTDLSPSRARFFPWLAPALLLVGLTTPEPAMAQLTSGTHGFRLYIIDMHNDSGPSTVIGAVVVVDDGGYTDAASQVWEGASEYWFWTGGGSFPTVNVDGDDGFRLVLAANQGNVVNYDPSEATDIYDGEPFTSFADGVTISGGSKRFKIWQVPNSGSPSLVGYLKESDPGHELTWYGYEGAVSGGGGYFGVGTSNLLWFEPTTSTPTVDDIGTLYHAPW